MGHDNRQGQTTGSVDNVRWSNNGKALTKHSDGQMLPHNGCTYCSASIEESNTKVAIKGANYDIDQRNQ